jgi:uncharacterized membrane protein
MNNYIIVGIVIVIICIFIIRSDFFKSFSDTNEYNDIKKIIKTNKLSSKSDLYDNSYDESDISYDIDENTSKIDDETEISFDSSSNNIKTKNNVKKSSKNEKILNDIKKMMLEIKNKDINKYTNKDINKYTNKGINKEINKGINKENLHKLALELKNNNQINNQDTIKTNNETNDIPEYDLTDTINGIINNELNNL